MDARGPKNQPPVGLPDPEEPDEPDDLLWVDPELDDVLVDEWPVAPVSEPEPPAPVPTRTPRQAPAPPPPAPPVRVVPPAELIRESSAADWIGEVAPEPGRKRPTTPVRRPLIEPVAPPAAGESALESVLGTSLPPLPSASRKAPPPSRRPGQHLDIAARYEARLRLSGLTGDAFVAARVATDPPATLKAAVVRFGRGADPQLSPIQPIADPEAGAEGDASPTETDRYDNGK